MVLPRGADLPILKPGTKWNKVSLKVVRFFGGQVETPNFLIKKMYW